MVGAFVMRINMFLRPFLSLDSINNRAYGHKCISLQPLHIVNWWFTTNLPTSQQGSNPAKPPRIGLYLFARLKIMSNYTHWPRWISGSYILVKHSLNIKLRKNKICQQIMLQKYNTWIAVLYIKIITLLIIEPSENVKGSM